MFFIIRNIVLPVAFVTGNFFSVAQITVYTTLNSGLPDNRVNKVLVDSAQRIWCATENGVALFDGSTWTVYNSSNSGLTDNYIRSLAFDEAGRLWVGTLSSGMFIYDGVTWQQIYSGNSGLSDDCVKDIQFDSLGHWWLATSGGLNYYDSTTWTVWNVFNSGLLTNNMSFVRFKGNEKHVGTINGGLNIFDATNALTTYTTFNSGLHDNTLPDGEFDMSGALWLATPAAGVMVHYNGNTWQWYYTGTSNIPTNSLNSVCIYNNKVYFTSFDNGFIVYNGVSFSGWNTTNSPLPEDYLLDVAHDSLGNIWLGSYSQGLIKVVESTLFTEENNPGMRISLVQNLLAPTEFLVLQGDRADRFCIRDSGGRILHQGPVNDNRISTTGLTSGFYQLVLYKGDEPVVYPFIISN